MGRWRDYNESRSELILDLDMTDAVPTVEWGNFVDYETVSSELQFISDNSSALKWVGGVFYYSEKSTTETFFDADPAIFAARFTEINDPLPTLESKALGVFVNIDYDVTDKLELVLGGRYSYDDKSMIRGLTRTYGGTVLTDTSGVTDLQKDWKKFTYRAGLNYHVSDDVMLFGSYSQGYRAGGFNAFAFQELSYEPESIDALEIGIKSHWLDDRIELNVSAFSNDYTDKQETVSKVIRDENGEEVDFVTSIQNSSTAGRNWVSLTWQGIRCRLRQTGNTIWAYSTKSRCGTTSGHFRSEATTATFPNTSRAISTVRSRQRLRMQTTCLRMTISTPV